MDFLLLLVALALLFVGFIFFLLAWNIWIGKLPKEEWEEKAEDLIRR